MQRQHGYRWRQPDALGACGDVGERQVGARSTRSSVPKSCLAWIHAECIPNCSVHSADPCRSVDQLVGRARVVGVVVVAQGEVAEFHGGFLGGIGEAGGCQCEERSDEAISIGKTGPSSYSGVFGAAWMPHHRSANSLRRCATTPVAAYPRAVSSAGCNDALASLSNTFKRSAKFIRFRCDPALADSAPQCLDLLRRPPSGGPSPRASSCQHLGGGKFHTPTTRVKRKFRYDKTPRCGKTPQPGHSEQMPQRPIVLRVVCASGCSSDCQLSK